MPGEGEKEAITVNDLLCYVQCMVDTLNRDQVVKSLLNHYVNEKELVAARDALFKSAPAGLPGGRLVSGRFLM